MDLILNLIQEHVYIFNLTLSGHQCYCSLKVVLISKLLQHSYVFRQRKWKSSISFFLHCEFHTRCHGPGGKLPEFQFSFPSLLLTNTPLTFSPQASFSPQNSVFLFTLFDQTSAFFTFTLETFYQNTLSFLPTFTLRLWTNAPLHPFLQKCWCSK